MDGDSNAGLSEALEHDVGRYVEQRSIASTDHDARSFRDIIESGAAGFWDWRLDNQTVVLSQRFKSTFGYTDDELPNHVDAWRALVHPNDLAVGQEAFSAHVASHGLEPFDVVLRHLHKDGSVVWVRQIGCVVEWSDDWQPRRAKGIHIDVTADMRRQEAQARKQEEIRRFAFATVHDLLQPVNTISSSLDAIAESSHVVNDSELEPYVDFVQSATQRLKTRVQAIIDYSHIQAYGVDREPVSLTEVAKTALLDVGAVVIESDASIVIGELGVANGAKALLERVFLNLFENAIKYRRQDRRCRVEVVEAPAPAGHVAVTLRDNGIGIEPRYRESVFGLFSRLHADSAYDGTGLGLAICQQIVERLGGEIGIDDGIDGGVAITFSLPAGE
ncbi:MAG: ATP-binding protein [Pseudomonadota bacterium]